MRIRAFRLIAAQARWNAVTPQVLEALLPHLDTDKPIAVRQYLSALQAVAIHEPTLRARLHAALQATELSRFRDSMRPLIEGDIAALMRLL